MFLLRSETLPEGPDWLYDLKLDGYRALAVKSGGKVQLRSRNENDFSVKYPSLVRALSPLSDETVIVGEIVALNESGLTAVKMAECRWVKPELVGQFVERTPDNHVRHACFVALREDKNPKEVTREP
jgi:bifunctional non-homologous end joining protein LigD